jgi:hypothetical protein
MIGVLCFSGAPLVTVLAISRGVLALIWKITPPEKPGRMSGKLLPPETMSVEVPE